jgi:hypothetical protein
MLAGADPARLVPWMALHRSLSVTLRPIGALDSGEGVMKVLDQAMDHCLLCIDFAFDQDSPANRVLSLRRLQPRIREKEWWRYHHVYRGLRTLGAREQVSPAGRQIAFSRPAARFEAWADNLRPTPNMRVRRCTRRERSQPFCSFLHSI